MRFSVEFCLFVRFLHVPLVSVLFVRLPLLSADKDPIFSHSHVIVIRSES